MTERQEVQLGNVCEILDRFRKPISKLNRIAGDIPYYGATGIVDYVADYLFDEQLVLVGEDGAKWGAGESTAFIINGKAWVNNHAHVLRPNRKIILDEWLTYYLCTQNLNEFVTGVTVPKLNQEKLKSISVPLPPLPEQKRIVAVLDEAFASIDEVIAHTEKNLANAHELFASHLNNALTPKDKGWAEKKLGEHCEFRRGLTYKKADEVDVSDNVVLRANNVSLGTGQLDLAELKYLRDDFEVPQEKLIERNTILICAASGSKSHLGKTALIDIDSAYAFGGFMGLLLPSDRLLPKFLFYLTKSKIYARFIASLSDGTNINNLRRDDLAEFQFFLPPLSEQKRIVASLDDVSNATQRLKAIYQKKLGALHELKQSLLQKAFAGELKIKTADITPFPQELPNISTTDLYAGILAIAYQHHKSDPKQLITFGHVKIAKIAYMTEAHIGLDLDINPVKDAAGPHDHQRLIKVEYCAEKKNWFDVRKNNKGYHLTEKRSFKNLVKITEDALGEHKKAVDRLIKLFVPRTTQEAEIIATVFAAWNNLLLNNQPVSDENIVYEARENWHKDKLKISQGNFLKGIEWLKKAKIVPQGKGRLVKERGKS